MSRPRISIITPSLNSARFLEQTIVSVLDQGYPELEYIVVDGGSTDGTLDILRKYDRRLRWFSEPDQGQADAINKGLRLSTGDILAYLNADDYYEPGVLQTVGATLSSEPEASWLTGKCRIVNEQGREVRRPITSYKNFWLRFNYQSILAILNYISQPATFWRRSVLNEVGLFDNRLNYALDYDYWLRVSRLHPLRVLDSRLASFRLHRDSKSGAGFVHQFNEEYEVAKRHVSSPALLRLHRSHKWLIQTVYRTLS
ncbi:MAG: glycosyltransferase [Chloroflexi bacterium]|nr:glycosyltransferase [Chloroflexota bacterium]